MSVDFLRIACQSNAMDRAGFIRLNVAPQRNQARMMDGAALERTARMKAQHVVDVLRQCREIDLAHLAEVALRQRTGDRYGLLPQLEGEGAVAQCFVRISVSLDRGAFQITVRTAAEAMVVSIVVNMTRRRAVIVLWVRALH